MAPILWGEMRVIFINGREVTLIWHEVWGLLWHPLFMAFVMVASVIIIFLRPYDDVLQLGRMQKTLF